MLRRNLSKKNGFTLIELMVTVTVAAILTSLAVPEYFGFIRESRRSDATSSIQDMMAQQALYYGNFGGTYTSSVTELGFIASGSSDTTTSQDGNYTIQLTNCEPATPIGDCIAIQATAASSSQLKDLTCRTIAINSRGTQFAESYDPADADEPVGAKVRANCWGN